MDRRRRKWLGALGSATAVSLVGWPSRSASAEPPPETTRIRISKIPTACLSPQYVAAELLQAEGFTDIAYVGEAAGVGGVPSAKALGEGRVDIAMNFAAPLAVVLDAGTPIVLLAGVHAGCFELVATRRMQKLTDLKGKTIAVLAPGSAQHIFLASIATSVGVDPNRDINWSYAPSAEAKQALAEERIDAFLAFPPDAQELRAKGVGHVLFNSAMDRPWSQYFCCLVSANRDFVQRNPVATKRALRAILKGSEICASNPERAVKAFLEQGFTTSKEYVAQAVREIPFGKWREFNPEDTLRFYALRLREAGMVKKSPPQLIAEGTDWRILEQLKKELKT